MRIRYDSQVDALSISFLDTTVTTQELAEGITAEYDARGQLVGLEILDAAKRFGDPSTMRRLDRGNRSHRSRRARPRIDDTDVKVIEVVLDKIGYGLSPEEIFEEHYRGISMADPHCLLVLLRS